ncbi:MAG: hypothetical protein GX219_04230 [Tissierellia bacterium]|nr:hypothetical protein [Tissierellia bacterium]
MMDYGLEQRFGLNTLIHRIGAVDENPNEDKEAIKNGADRLIMKQMQSIT